MRPSPFTGSESVAFSTLRTASVFSSRSGTKIIIAQDCRNANYFGMRFIKTGDNEYLNVNAVQSYSFRVRDVEKTDTEPVGGGISKVTGRTAVPETVLYITTTGGERITLYGSEADAALDIFRSR